MTMIEHMVWIRFRDEIGPERTEQHIAALRALKQTVPAVVELSVGRNFTDRANGCTHGLLVRVRSGADLEAYLKHPEHVRAATALRADASIMALDIET
jgi:hypothetical protein